MKLKNHPLNTIVLITDPDHDRLTVTQIENISAIARLEKAGIDYLKLNLPFSLINEELGVEGTGYAAIKYKDQIYLGTNNGAFVQKDTSNNLQPYPFDLINSHFLF